MTPTVGRPLEGRVAIVTGAGRGIGRSEALALAAAGAAVVINDVGGSFGGVGQDAGPAHDVVAEIEAAGGQAVPSVESVSDWEGAERIVATAVERFGRLDILVNNAGIVRHQLIEEITEDDVDAVLQVNLKGTFALCRHAVPVLRRQGGGRIINTASNQWAAPIGNAHYAASKGGVVSLTYDLAWELQHEHITVNAVAPFAATRMTAEAGKRDEQSRARGTMSERRLRAKEERAEPDMVAPIVVYLATDEAAHVTGCVFRAGGGKVGMYSHPTEVRAIFRDQATGPWPVGELVELLPKTVLRGETTAPHIG
jgi:NAD(P)-dependent dehydrogenase (short-subunit alcohol dehydrogenase family)